MSKAKAGPPAATASQAPPTASERYRGHDTLIRRLHHAGLTPTEIAFLLNGQGVRVRMWAVTDGFVRNRLERMGIKPHHSRAFFHNGRNIYRPRSARQKGTPAGRAHRSGTGSG